MGLILAAAVIAGLAAACKYITVLSHRIDADIAVAGDSPVEAGAIAPRAARLDRPLSYSERELRRRTRVLMDEIERFLASQDC